MKKIVRFVSLILVLIMIAGCGEQTNQSSDSSTEESLPNTSEEATESPDNKTTWLDNHSVQVELTPSEATLQNRALAETLYESFLEAPPIDFLYGEDMFREHLSDWSRSEESTDNGVTVTYTHSDKAMTVVLDYRFYEDSSAIEWGIRLRNDSTENSRKVTNFKTLSFAAQSKGNTKLMYSKGGNASDSDFEPQYQSLKDGESCKIFSSGGRSSSGVMPFFNLYTGKNAGYIGAIGWSGQWKVEAKKENGTVSIEGGMSDSGFYLNAGESVMQPTMILLPWEGDAQEGHNDLRRHILAYHTPRTEDGEFPEGVISYGDWGGAGSETLCADAKAIGNLDIGIDVLWVDAGWNGTDGSYSKNTFDSIWFENVGTWDAIPALFPNGMREVSDAAHKDGTAFLLWFEPERAFKGTNLITEHPEYFLSYDANPDNFIFNLGNEEARQWLTDYVAGLIKEYGVDIYRQDFNIEPLDYWRAADDVDRTGITEMKYIEGFYQFWDGLLEQCPGLIIDNCASGGRRLDFEALSRSLSLFRSDYFCYTDSATAEGCQIEYYGINFWLPLHGTSAMCRTDSYQFRSVFGFSIQEPGIFGKADEQSILNKEHETLMPYCYGDYYPLTGCTNDNTGWFAYQMNRRDLESGFVCAFRRLQAEDAFIMVSLSGLNADATYKVTVTDTEESYEATGKELMENGMTISIDRKKDSRIIRYEIVK